MTVPFIPGMPGFAITPARTAFGTVVTALIPPFPGNGGAPLVYGMLNGHPNWSQQLFTHLTSLPINNGGTANLVYVMRPLNWTTISVAMAKNTTAITLADDPGVFSTNYRYPLPGKTFLPPGTAHASGDAPSQVADNAIAANDYVAFQLDDGTWMSTTIASGTFAGANLVLTAGTPNRNGGTVAAGRPLFWYGIKTDSNPATGLAHLNLTPTVSVVEDQLSLANTQGIPSLNPGDPLLLLNENATATTAILGAYGDYRRY